MLAEHAQKPIWWQTHRFVGCFVLFCSFFACFAFINILKYGTIGTATEEKMMILLCYRIKTYTNSTFCTILWTIFGVFKIFELWTADSKSCLSACCLRVDVKRKSLSPIHPQCTRNLHGKTFILFLSGSYDGSG